jgi:hypothetical protein
MIQRDKTGRSQTREVGGSVLLPCLSGSHGSEYEGNGAQAASSTLFPIGPGMRQQPNSAAYLSISHSSGLALFFCHIPTGWVR